MKKICLFSFLHALGIAIYVSLVATLMQNGDRLFGEMNNVVGPIAFLMLFTLSAAIVGSLGLGKPILLFLDGKKKEAVSFFLSTVGWLLLFTIIALVIAAFVA